MELPRTILYRLERKVDHLHVMIHGVAEAVAALADSAEGNAALAEAAALLKKKTADVQKALWDQSPESPEEIVARHSLEGESLMANPAVQTAIDAMTAATSLDDSVLAFLNGVPAMIAAAKAEAVANGATAEELAPFDALSAELTAKGAAVKAALVANTPISASQAAKKAP